MELGTVGKPNVLVPYPHAQGNHQLFNAKILADVGKALIVEEGEHFVERLRAAIQTLLAPDEYRRMIERPLVTRNRDAADRIAEGCLDLIRGG